MMAANLENLIEKIKKEGVEEGKKQSQEIIKNAEQQAEKIAAEAKKEAEARKEEAYKDISNKERNAKKSIQQAGRNVVLTVRQELERICKILLERQISESMKPELVADLIKRVVEEWPSNREAAFEVLVSKEDKEKIEKLVLAEFKKDAKNGIEIKINRNIRKGFRIGIKGEDTYYDFSQEAVTQALGQFLAPQISQLLTGQSE